MKMPFDTSLAENYTSRLQKVRVMSEAWVKKSIYCPSCGNNTISAYTNNRPVADFNCPSCDEDFELKSCALKSKSADFRSKIVDGAYRTMRERLKGDKNPNLFLLGYNIYSLEVSNFLVIPKHFFTMKIIEKRSPLKSPARRAGWTGCNILLKSIPSVGKIFLIQDGVLKRRNKVLTAWKKTSFLRDKKITQSKGWVLDTMFCIEKIGKKAFKLAEMYEFENLLRQKHPENRHVKDKIRQQLQLLRKRGYLEFTGRGEYRLV